MPFLLRATPRQDLAGRSVRSEANLTAAGHSRDTPDQTHDATKSSNALRQILHQGSRRYRLRQDWTSSSRTSRTANSPSTTPAPSKMMMVVVRDQRAFPDSVRAAAVGDVVIGGS